MYNQAEPSVSPGRRVYGVDIGILITDSRMPRPVGDMGNARTFDFPVMYHAVQGGNPDIVVEQDPKQVLELFVEGARQLVDYGVAGITTTCGFLAAVQPELAASTSVPVMTSSLLQIPAALRSVGPDRKLVVVTANGTTLGATHFEGVGVTDADRERISIVGVEDCDILYPHLMNRSQGPMDVRAVTQELVDRCSKAARADSRVAGFVFECANLPPYAGAVRAATGLPVWDAVSLTTELWRAVRRNT